MWLKKCARHAHFHFELPKGMAVFLSELCPSNLVESWKLISTTTGENLVSISQTTFEKFKINQNISLPLDNQSYILYLWMSNVYSEGWIMDDIALLKSVLKYQNYIFTHKNSTFN